MESRNIAEFLYKYRFLLIGTLLVILVLLELNGSSIGMWTYYFTRDAQSNSDALLGNR